MVAKRISLFNHKGGVSKTTTTFNLGWMLASKGKRVVLVDADPQCNLTGMALGYKGQTELEKFYKTETSRNFHAGLAPAFESRPMLIKAVDCVPIAARSGLFLLPGHIRLAEYEVTLGIAQALSGSIQTLQNLPGSISYLIRKTAEKFRADYVLVDMSPSLSSINQNLLMTSDYFLVPTSPDYFSVMAIDSLTMVLPDWGSWLKQAQSMQILRDATYPFPQTTPKLLGTIIQNYRPRSGAPAAAFQAWVDEIKGVVASRLVPTLEEIKMTLPEHVYTDAGLKSDLCLATIADFNSLIAKSQKSQTPVFALTVEQIKGGGKRLGGKVLERTLTSQTRFKRDFEDLADKIIHITNDEISN